MASSRPSEELVARFEAALPADPRVQCRPVAGGPCAFVNGQLFCGLAEERLYVRLDERGRTELLGMPGSEPFAPLLGEGRPEYVVVPPRVVAGWSALRDWVERAFAYGLSLPAKSGRSARRPAASRAPPKRRPTKPTPRARQPVKRRKK